MYAGLLALRARGVSPRSAVDAGACTGKWTRLFSSVFPQCVVLMIEPQQRHLAALREYAASEPARLKLAQTLVGPPGVNESPFVVLDDESGTGSSVLPENSDVPRHVEVLSMTTLDKVIESTALPPPDFIKLDVQGYEVEVLKGAAGALRTAEFVLLESSVRQYNSGSPLLADVVALMDAAGFRPYDIVDLMRGGDAVLLQADILFVSKRSSLIRDPMSRFNSGAR